MNKLLILLGLVIVSLINETKGNCNSAEIADALQCAVSNGGDVTKLSSFVTDVSFYVNDNVLTDLQANSLLASNVLKLFPEAFLYYPTYLNTKMVMYFDQIIRYDVLQFVAYAVEIIFPNNGFNSTGAQSLIDDLINNNIPLSYNTSDAREVIQLIVDYVDIPTSISDVLFWLYDNEDLAESDPNTYFKYLINGLLDNFVLPEELEDFGSYLNDFVTFPTNGTREEWRQMIRDFLGSEYIPDSISAMVDEITLNQKNFMQMETEASGAVIASLEWKLFENDLALEYQNTQWADEWSWVQKLISNYLLSNFTQILYINEPNATDYLFYQINAYLNTTNIRDGWKDLYTILLKLPMSNADEASIIQELESFVSTTDIIDNNLRLTIDALFRGDEMEFIQDLKTYIESLSLSSITQNWYDNTFSKITSVQDIGNILSNGFDEIENFILLVIDIMDQDEQTFGTLTGPFWPNNLVFNLNRIASNVKYLNETKKMLSKFTNAVFLSITDMYTFEYPYKQIINITSQVLPIIIEENDYYFPEVGDPKIEEFLDRMFGILESTLTVTSNGKDLIDVIQLYVEMYAFNDTDFNGVVNFICDQSKDITMTLCTVFEMVNSTITLIDEFESGTQNFTYPDSINDIKNTLNIPGFLPFISDFIDALVSTFYPTEGAKIVSVIDTTYNYWTISTVSSTEIVNLIGAIGDLYLTGETNLENTWKYTIDYVEKVLAKAPTELAGKTDSEINTLIDGYTNSVSTPAPTIAKVATASPTGTLDIQANKAINHYSFVLMACIVLITFLMY